MKAISITRRGLDWLAKMHQARILHVFDDVCNLINEEGDVLSVVTPRIGNGPFNLVCGEPVRFSEFLTIESQVSGASHHLTLEDLTINTLKADLWEARPDWEMLHSQRSRIVEQLTPLQITGFEFSNPLCMHLVSADREASLQVISGLAGLGPGLTPAGDDFIMGALYAAWIIHPALTALSLAEEIENAAVRSTTSLSAAYLKSAARGEAGIVWHAFFEALIALQPGRARDSMEEILAIGATSGADALAGFISTLICYAETNSTVCRS